MTTDSDFLDELEAFLDPDNLPLVITPRASVEKDLAVAQETAESVSSHTEQEKTTPRQEPVDNRRKRYRERVKNERQELKRIERELTQRLQELIDSRQGTNTSARTDLSISTSFWKDLATQQKQHRLSSEDEQKRLVAAVQSQTLYIDNLCSVRRVQPENFIRFTRSSVQPLDNLKWLRLKSSDASLYELYLKEVNDSYARVDQVFADCGMDAVSIGAESSQRRLNADGGVEFIQYVHKMLQPSSFQNTCRNVWKAAKLPHRQLDREVYEDLTDLGNTIAFKFRLKKTLTTGSSVSILRRVLARQFIENDRTVIVYKIFAEGEGIFSGLDTDETAWVSIRPYSDGSKSGALMEICSQQVPAPFLSTRNHDSTVKAFKEMTREAVQEEERAVIRLLEMMHLGDI
ncbi:hypothetical protein DVH05_000297 [Phytophthora capsici]|nr:hypothetical protein DVH05_000297 [Phytophthora capsici]